MYLFGHPRELESFRNFKGLRIIFPKILDEICSITKVRHFLIPLSMKFFNPKILGFLQKIERNLLDKLRKWYMNGTVI